MLNMRNVERVPRSFPLCCLSELIWLKRPKQERLVRILCKSARVRILWKSARVRVLWKSARVKSARVKSARVKRACLPESGKGVPWLTWRSLISEEASRFEHRMPAAYSSVLIPTAFVGLRRTAFRGARRGR